LSLFPRPRKINPISAEGAANIVEEDFHGADICDVVVSAPGEDVADDAVGAVLDDPGAGVAADCLLLLVTHV
jgi:hypothetical protein